MIYNDDCIKGMKHLADDSVDLIVTDPPYGMSFMGKQWDKALPPRAAFEQMLRVLKPGAFAFVMCAPRSDLQARMSILLEDAGFNIAFTPIYWTFASGFPKAQNISKQIDKRNGKHQPTPEFKQYLKDAKKKAGLTCKQIDSKLSDNGSGIFSQHYTGNNKQSEYPTIEKYQILKDLLNLDNTYDELIEREEAEREILGQKKTKDFSHHKGSMMHKETTDDYTTKTSDIDITADATPEAIQYNGAYAGYQPKPALEVIIVAMKPKTEKTYVDQVLSNGKGITWLDDCRIPYKNDNEWQQHIRKDHDNGNSTDQYKYTDHKKGIPNQEGRYPANLLVSDYSLNDHSRYFDLDAWFAIVPKPAKSEKNKGIESNKHPTVKPIKLMSYLITLGSRPGDVILDPFMGSGTTGISAKLTGREFIGFEMEEEYFNIAEARIDAWETGATGQDKEGRPSDKEDGKRKQDGRRAGQISLEDYTI
jgi:DNA modification methylase